MCEKSMMCWGWVMHITDLLAGLGLRASAPRCCHKGVLQQKARQSRLGAATKVFSSKMLGSYTNHTARKDAVDVGCFPAG